MGLPKLRFKGYKGKWEGLKIGDIATVSTGLTPLRSNHSYYEDGSIPWVKTMDLNNSFIKSTDEMVNEKAIRDTSLTLLPSNTLLVAMYGGFNQIGRTGITTFVGVTNQAISALRPKGDFFDAVFLQNYLNHKVGKWRNVAASSRKDPNLTKSDIENFRLYLPSKEEQTRMASFFTLIDQKTEKQQEKIEQLELFKKGMLQKIFSQEIRFKDENGNEFPSWVQTVLGSVSQKITRKNTDFSILNVISNSAKYGLVSQRDYFDKDIANSDNINGYFVIEEGDFVYNPRISSESPYGPINVYSFSEAGVVSPLYLCFRIHGVNKTFLSYFFKSSEWYRHIYEKGDSGARHDRVSIKDEEFFNMPIYLPSTKEQMRIASFFETIDNKITAEKLKLKYILLQKQGLMQEMLI